jgi:hypothetical protein
MRKPPSRALCFALAQSYWENTPQNKKLSWEYLVCWGMYEMYVDGWWQE